MRKIIIGACAVVVLFFVASLFTPYGGVHLIGHSMEPTISHGDSVLIVPPVSVSTGDIIAFKMNGFDRPTIHRVVNETPDGFVTKGDGNPYTDQSAGARYIEDDDVIAEAPQFAGYPLIIPNGYTYFLLLVRSLGEATGFAGLSIVTTRTFTAKVR